MKSTSSRDKSVSILKETMKDECRVVLLPHHIFQFCQAGFKVFVEQDAGSGMGIQEKAYQAVGATIVSTEDAWNLSPFVLKYKAPLPQEFAYFHAGLHLGAFFHAEGNKPLTTALCKHSVTAYSYELFKTPDGIFPLSVASSEIAGKLAVLHGAYYLQRPFGGAGILLAGVVGLKPPKVLVIGYGNAGGAAARLAATLGAEVVVLGTNRERLRRFQATVPSSVTCSINSPEVLARELPEADLVIGAILISTYDTPAIIDENLVKCMKKGAVIVDITCGYGTGYLATGDLFTSFDHPVVERHGVLHCKIKTLPAAVPVTTNEAISTLITPYLIALGNAIFDDRMCDPTSASGKIVEHGVIVHPEVQRHMKMIDALEGRYVE